MSLKYLFAAAFLLCYPLQASTEDANPQAPGTTSSATASDLSPSSESANGAPLSPSASDLEDDAAAVSSSAALYLSATSTSLLASIAQNIHPDQLFIYYSLEDALTVDGPGNGTVKIDPNDLYSELQVRSRKGDQDARHALDLALLRGDPRAAAAGSSSSLSPTAQSLSPSAGSVQGLSGSATPQALSPTGASPSPSPSVP